MLFSYLWKVCQQFWPKSSNQNIDVSYLPPTYFIRLLVWSCTVILVLTRQCRDHGVFLLSQRIRKTVKWPSLYLIPLVPGNYYKEIMWSPTYYCFTKRYKTYSNRFVTVGSGMTSGHTRFRSSTGPENHPTVTQSTDTESRRATCLKTFLHVIHLWLELFHTDPFLITALLERNKDWHSLRHWSLSYVSPRL